MDRRSAVRRTSLTVVLAALLGATACDLPQAQGDVNAFIVGAPTDLWNDVQDAFLGAMAPTIQTVRSEQPFRITQQDPTDPQGWGLLRRFRMVLVLGVRGDPWIDEALKKADEPVGLPPVIVQADNVWARGQEVSVLLLPEGSEADAVRQLVPQLHEVLDGQFRQYAMNRMFASGENSALEDSLMTNVGFSLRLPGVYHYAEKDSVFRFRNDSPTPAELIREIVVSWRTPIPDSLPTADDLVSWREDLARTYYVDPQVVDTTLTSYRDIDVNGLTGIEYQAAWVSPPGIWPGGGPSITRVLRCPAEDRLYYVDAWLYAPGKDKYEYMIQLQTLLDSFRCRS